MAILPRTKVITGANLTGADGTANRTYVVSDPNPFLSAGISITINGFYLVQGSGKDFTISSQTITFLNIVDNSDNIQITYFVTDTSTASSITSGTLKYATTEQLAEAIGIKVNVPTWEVKETPEVEEVGTGDNTTTIFYLDQQNILANTYNLYHGATRASLTSLTEGTHYDVDLTKGRITLTASGVTEVGTNKIYAEYSHTKNGMTDAYLTDVLARAEDELENLLNTTFTDGTGSNPSYPSTTEYQPSKGQYDLNYFTHKRPIKDVNSLLDTTITSSDTSISVTTGDGSKFPTSGTIIIGEEIITYTGVSTDTLTGCTRGVRDSTAAAHTAGAEIHTTILEISGTQEGTAPTWYPKAWRSNMTATEETGKIFLYEGTAGGDIIIDNILLPQQDVDDRIRITYLHGYDTVPLDIVRLTILLAKRSLASNTISKSLIAGRDEFKPRLFNHDEQEIMLIANKYQQLQMENT